MATSWPFGYDGFPIHRSAHSAQWLRKNIKCSTLTSSNERCYLAQVITSLDWHRHSENTAFLRHHFSLPPSLSSLARFLGLENIFRDCHRSLARQGADPKLGNIQDNHQSRRLSYLVTDWNPATFQLTKTSLLVFNKYNINWAHKCKPFCCFSFVGQSLRIPSCLTFGEQQNYCSVVIRGIYWIPEY